MSSFEGAISQLNSAIWQTTQLAHPIGDARFNTPAGIDTVFILAVLLLSGMLLIVVFIFAPVLG